MPKAAGAGGDELADAAEADHGERLVGQLDAPERGCAPSARRRAPRGPAGMLRARASISAIVCSAADNDVGLRRVETSMPRAVAASTSTLSTPMPARPITRSRVPADQLGVDLVAERTTSAS